MSTFVYPALIVVVVVSTTYLASYLAIGPGPFDMDPGGEPKAFEEHLKRYQQLFQLIVTLSTATVAFLVNFLVSISTEKPRSLYSLRLEMACPFAVLTLGFSVIFALLFITLENLAYEGYSEYLQSKIKTHHQRQNPYSRRWYATNLAVGYPLGLFNAMTTDSNDQIPIKRYRLGQMASYEILVSDFDRIESEAMTIGTDFAFAVALLPVAVAFTLTLAVSTISVGWIRDSFLFSMFACYILGLYFAVRAYRQRGHLKRFMQVLREAQVAPLGEKGSEIGPSELEALPAEGQSSGPEKKK